ncbi:gluconeogenesis factor YvcK family protein [Collinsella sp. zg1085]|uniref:gluconeogenesis factor YvcK family protein n=1 Tax=Collinsella sp. zg1085 TaxID=2844380 RepID=UPI00209B80AA|nr:gluconeogenesis factor YvcK family protein [Collinsella sp. zg1085]
MNTPDQQAHLLQQIQPQQPLQPHHQLQPQHHQPPLTQRPLRVVSLGGGTGQPTLIAALRAMHIPVHIDAIVAMADDGRSSGSLRAHEHILPPGDLRKCLVALSYDPQGVLAQSFEHRFSYLEHHTVGNLFLAALNLEGASVPEALAICEEMLGCVGHVHPSTLEDIQLVGETARGELVRGQALLSYGSSRLRRVWLDPESPKIYAGAREALAAADVIIMGPGSLFTSLMPNVLVPELAQSLRQSQAKRIFIGSIADVPGETEGMSAIDYIDALEAHGMVGVIDTAVFHAPRPAHLSQTVQKSHLYSPVVLGAADERALRERVSQVIVSDFSDPISETSHNVIKLASTLKEVCGSCRLAQR